MTSEPPSIADQVDEGILLIGASVRMVTKNVIIVRALRGDHPWDERALIEGVRSTILGLLTEHDLSLHRLERTIPLARSRRGESGHPADFRRKDLSLLTRRLAVGEAMSVALRRLRENDVFLREVLFDARDAATDEIVHATRMGPDPTLTDDDQAARLAALGAEIAIMAEQHNRMSRLLESMGGTEL